MNLQEPLEISREKMVVNLLFVNSILCGFNSCFFLFLLSRKEWGVCWLLAGFTLFIVFLWGKKTPYMRVTSTELMIFPSLLHSPMFISWEKISNRGSCILDKCISNSIEKLFIEIESQI